MEKLWCMRKNTTEEREQNPVHSLGLIPCIGETCERWNEFDWDCIHLHRQKRFRR